MPAVSPVIVKTKRIKTSPTSPRSNALLGGQYHLPSIPLSVAIWGHTGKSACQKIFSACLAFISLGSESFLPPFILTFYLPVLQGGGDWFAMAVLMGIALASPCMYVHERCHMQQIFPLSGLTILLPNSTVAHSLCPCHAWLCPRAWLSHKRDSWQSKQNLWSVRSPLDFTW